MKTTILGERRRTKNLYIRDLLFYCLLLVGKQGMILDPSSLIPNSIIFNDQR